jgi:hypothetical protein
MAGSFSADLSSFSRHANSNVDRAVKDTVLTLGREIVELSIVGDTLYWSSKPPKGYVGGKFRANWQHGIGTMPITTFDTTANVSYARIKSTVPASSGGKIHWLVNNVSYSIALENGTASPRTPPQGTVGTVVLRYGSIVREVARNIHR